MSNEPISWYITVPDNIADGVYELMLVVEINDTDYSWAEHNFTITIGSGGGDTSGCTDSAVITPASSFESMLSFANIPSETDTKFLPYVTLDDNDCFDWVEVEFVNYDFDGQEVLNSEWANSFIANLNDW
jgi:hypothetical protein